MRRKERQAGLSIVATSLLDPFDVLYGASKSMFTSTNYPTPDGRCA